MIKQSLLSLAIVITALAMPAASEQKQYYCSGAECSQPLTKETASERLREAYDRYILIKVCHEVRQGYLITWINDAELARARNAVSRVETDARAKNPDLDVAVIWAESNAKAAATLYRDFCQIRLRELERQGYASSPREVQKDF
jgi:hypothetical protein